MSSIGHHWREAGEHLFVAIVVAAVVVILEQYRLIGWLDSAMLRIAGTARASSQVASGGPAVHDWRLPFVITLTDTMYETDFQQQSPLDRETLARLIEVIASRGPAMLTVDIDLSPGPAGASGNRGQEILDRLLERIARAGTTKLVLATPLPVRSGDLVAIKYKWMLGLCRAGIQFGLSDVLQTQGVVLRVSTNHASLGVVAQQVSGATGPRPPPYASWLPMDWSALPFSAGEFSVDHALVADDFHRQLPLNADYFAAMESAAMPLDSVADAAGLPPLVGRTVFLGGEYEGRDQFITAFGRQPGVVIHAATFYSGHHPIKGITHAFAVALDVVVGVLCGYLFHWSWQVYNRAARAFEEHRAGPDRWRRYALVRGLLIGNLLLVAILVLVLVKLSAAVFQFSLWVNPGPVIIGVFAKTLIASRAGLHRGPDSHHAQFVGVGRRSHGLPVGVADAALALAIVTWAAILWGH
ncbi:MAG: CHASE2 domain-containing protein [Sterolibacteriaceae bacterium]|nr:CHASE2 domain-containing protein [Sterolibacteriaceae bacterium]